MSSASRLTLTALVLLAVPPPARASDQFVVDPARSRVTVHVGRSGLLSFAGHEHRVSAPVSEGQVSASAAALASSSVRLRFETAALRVDAAREPSGDAPAVQKAMMEKVLHPERFPAVSFRSTAVSGRETSPGHYRLQVTGELQLHGVTRPLEVPVEVEVQEDTLTAQGRVRLSHEQFGLERVSAGGGAVKVKDALEVEFSITARRSSGGRAAGR